MNVGLHKLCALCTSQFAVVGPNECDRGESRKRSTLDNNVLLVSLLSRMRVERERERERERKREREKERERARERERESLERDGEVDLCAAKKRDKDEQKNIVHLGVNKQEKGHHL